MSNQGYSPLQSVLEWADHCNSIQRQCKDVTWPDTNSTDASSCSVWKYGDREKMEREQRELESLNLTPYIQRHSLYTVYGAAVAIVILQLTSGYLTGYFIFIHFDLKLGYFTFLKSRTKKKKICTELLKQRSNRFQGGRITAESDGWHFFFLFGADKYTQLFFCPYVWNKEKKLSGNVAFCRTVWESLMAFW